MSAQPAATAAPSTATATSAAKRTGAVVEDYLAARLAGDVGRLVELFADEVDWQLAPNPVVPWIRPRSTGAECAAQVADLLEFTVPADAGARVDAFLVDGADAVLTGQLWGRVRSTGKAFESPFALRLTVEGGRITRHHLYEDGLAIAEACTPAEVA